MKRFIVFVIIILFYIGNIFAAQTDNNAATQRFGIFIGSNNGGRERVTLRYAVTDARSMLNVFLDMGGIASNDTVLLVEPSIREVNNRIDALHRQVMNAKSANKRTEIIFYYSGHSDEEGLLLNREKFMYRDLRDRINDIPSDMKIVILDSCASGAFTRLKGGEKTVPFLVDSSFTAEGYAFLTSSSANESSQESDRIAASYFTHSLITGLRGAADTVGDGRVTLNELYRFAYAETLARTETSLYGTQHPSYDIQISGTGDLVLTDINQNSAGLIIDERITGRLSIRNNRDQLVVELSKNSRALELGLEPGSYRITLQQENEVLRAEVVLTEGQRTLVKRDNFSVIATERTRQRGDDDSSGPSRNLYTGVFNLVNDSFKAPLAGFINIGIGNQKIFHLGFFNWTTQNFLGSQIGFVNTTGGDYNGFQVGFINTNAKNTSGVQTGFINTSAGETRGAQFGYVNTSRKDLSGAQIGFVNNSIGETRGIQIGFVNTSVNEASGVQVGFINSSIKKMNGLQLGLINYAESIQYGVPIGLISIVKNGGYKTIEYSFSEFFTYSAGLKLGVDIFYTSVFFAYNQKDELSWNNFSVGCGIGSILSISKGIFLNPEMINMSNVTNEFFYINYYSVIFSAGINLGKLSITAGPSVTWVAINNGQSAYENLSKSYDLDVKNISMPDPLFSLGTYDLNEYNRIVVGARISARIKL